MRDLLKEEGIKVHFFESRVKSPESLADKIRRPDKSYESPLEEVTDLIGLRIVLYYQDDIESVSKLIGREFTVYERVDAHQVDDYSPDRFGYLSAHFIVGLNESRASLTEWKATASKRIEIQVRTVLQHSWAAVSHILQYKREADVPPLLRRRLFRLAGLFELADEQFMEIRDEAMRLSEGAKELYIAGAQNIALDVVSVREFVRLSPKVDVLLERISGMGFVVDDEAILEARSSGGDYAPELVDLCQKLGILTTNDLESLFEVEYGAYFEELMRMNSSEKWIVSREFAVILLVILAQWKQILDKHLLEGQGWSPSILNIVIESARKIRP